jgi:hypothetical protein
MRLCHVVAIAAAAVLAALPAAAQDRRPSHCIAIADAAPGIEYIQRAAWADPVPEWEVRISYIDHSMFLIRTHGGLSAITDYNGRLGPADFAPDVATMNHAHSTHWTAMPDPRIPHVLKGWGDGRVAQDHNLDLGEMLVRNVATDIRSRWGDGAEKFGNSIFVFEVEGLCIGHLGHLHHEPDAAQYAALGRLDVVMAAVDGGLTVDLPTMLRVLKRLRSSVVIPMHWFGRATLETFLAGMAGDFDVVRTGESSIALGLRTLPDRPTVMVLEPAYLAD